jgi:hypothetical protein
VIIPASTTRYLNIKTTTGFTGTIQFLGGAGVGNIIIEAKRVA